MNRYLFFDTETTGLPRDWKAPVTAVDFWPRMVQVAWIVCGEDGEATDAKVHIIKPDGYEIPEKASAIHGITTEKAMETGVDLLAVIDEMAPRIAAAQFVVAHNISFDEKVLGAEFLRMKMPYPFAGKKLLCTMRGGTKFCDLPGKYGPKFPKLIELHEKLFAEGFEGAHDALSDVLACRKCYFELRKRGVMQ